MSFVEFIHPHFLLFMNVKTILNAAALVLGMVGLFFKSQWWAGADMLILAGLGLLLISAVAFTVRDNSEAGTSAAVNYLMVATVAVGILGLAFKTMHWQGGSILAMGTGALLLILSLMLIASKTTLVVSRQFVTVLVIFCTMLTASLNMVHSRPGAPVASTPVEQPAAE